VIAKLKPERLVLIFDQHTMALVIFGVLVVVFYRGADRINSIGSGPGGGCDNTIGRNIAIIMPLPG
jgi:hypothetical protein